MSINKKILIGVLMVVILIFGLIIGWAILQKEKAPPEEVTKEEIDIGKELRELEGLREGAPLLTEDEAQVQHEELEELRGDVEYLSEEAQKELEELERLRQLQ